MVARLGFDVGQIQQGHVHAHGADDRYPPALGQRLGPVRQPAAVAVGVAHRHDAEPGRAGSRPYPPVAGPSPGRHLPDLQELAHHRQDRPELPLTAGRVEPEQRQAGAHEGVPSGGVVEGRGAVCQMQLQPRALILRELGGDEGREALLLFGCAGALWIVGVGQVREQAAQLQKGVGADPFQASAELARVEAQAMHAYVHLQMNRL